MLAQAVEEQGIDPQTGFGPTIWNAWETNWTGRDVTTTTRTRTVDVPASVNQQGAGGKSRFRQFQRTVQADVVEET